MVTGEYLTQDVEHTVQYTDFITQKCICETYMFMLTNITQINLKKQNANTKKQHKKCNAQVIFYQLSIYRNKATKINFIYNYHLIKKIILI